MVVLVLGLVLFLGAHSVRIFAEGWRVRVISRMGLQPWKGIYSLASIVGFVLIIWGFGLARSHPTILWAPPTSMRHLAALLTLIAFILVAAAYVPGNSIKSRLHHPMVLGIKVWAVAHLLANGTLADTVLFGAFLVWAVFDFSAARRRDRAAGTLYAPGRWVPTAIAMVVGGVAWALFAFWLHALLIGVRPFA
ncbi:MAG: NnrU family protein [Burkholderiaceae bacterium]